MYEGMTNKNKKAEKKVIVEKNETVKSKANEWDHPFAKFEPIEEAQRMYQEASINPELSIDAMHFKSNQGLIRNAFKKVVDQNHLI